MYEIEMHEASEEFAECWSAAGRHLSHQAGGQLQSWLRAQLTPPFLEHLSFRLGNQLFFIRIEDVDGLLQVPGNPRGLLSIADACKGHACVMPMRRRGGEWVAVSPGWGLVDARTGSIVDPPALVSAEDIEMTEWELQSFAVQVVRDQLVKEGRQLMSWSDNPEVNPSLWFVGDAGPEWVVIRAARFPEEEAQRPANFATIRQTFEARGFKGHFASVAFADSRQADASSDEPMPLYRGYGMYAAYGGLEGAGETD